MLQFARPILPALVLFAAAHSSMAQTSGPVVTELLLERQLMLTTTLTSTELALPSDKVQGIISGALEVRERLVYNPAGATLTSTIFVVQPGSVMPTPINSNLTGAIIGVYTLNVEKIYSTVSPMPVLAFTGTVAGATFGGVLGNVTGMPFLVSMAYTRDTPAKVSDVVHLIAGRVAAFTRGAAGRLIVPQAVIPPAPAGGLDVIIVAPASTIDSQVTLDASQTRDNSGTSLSFSWKLLNKTSAILNPNTAMATVQFGEGLGDYLFELTVTNGNGVTVKKTVTVSYYGR